MTPVYAIGDVHGNLDALLEAISLVEADGGPDAKIVFLGDYTDRGAQSAGVLSYLVQSAKERRNWVYLKGNHDRMFEYFMEDTPRHDPYLLVGYHWLHDRLGGRDTLKSYGIEWDGPRRLYDVHAEAKAKIPQDHIDFLRGLDITHRHEDLLFVHAGLRPGVPFADQTEEDMIWIRDEFLTSEEQFPWTIVHGHSPVQTPTRYSNRVNLDGGAGYGRPLVPAVFENGDVWVLSKEGRAPIETEKR